MQTEKIIGVGAAGLAALGLGVAGASLASADDAPASGSSTTQGQSQGTSEGDSSKGERPAPVDDGRELSADAASKAVTAAEGKESDAAVKGVHLARNGGYEVMMLRADGTMVEVAVDESFTVTGAEERDGRGGPGGHHGGHGGPGRPGRAPGDDGSQGSDEAPEGEPGTQTPSPSASSTAS